MNCDSCGKQIMEGSSFCVYCGAQIHTTQPKPSTAPNTLLGGTVSVSTPSTSISHPPVFGGPPKPWYRSTGCLVLAFLFFMPLWQILILTDKDAAKWLKVAAVVIFVMQITCSAFYVILLISGAIQQY